MYKLLLAAGAVDAQTDLWVDSAASSGPTLKRGCSEGAAGCGGGRDVEGRRGSCRPSGKGDSFHDPWHGHLGVSQGESFPDPCQGHLGVSQILLDAGKTWRQRTTMGGKKTCSCGLGTRGYREDACGCGIRRFLEGRRGKDAPAPHVLSTTDHLCCSMMRGQTWL